MFPFLTFLSSHRVHKTKELYGTMVDLKLKTRVSVYLPRVFNPSTASKSRVRPIIWFIIKEGRHQCNRMHLALRLNNLVIVVVVDEKDVHVFTVHALSCFQVIVLLIIEINSVVTSSVSH